MFIKQQSSLFELKILEVESSLLVERASFALRVVVSVGVCFDGKGQLNCIYVAVTGQI